LEEAFVLDENMLPKLNEKEKEMIYKFIKAKHCNSLCISQYDLYFIPPDNMIEEDFIQYAPNLYQKILPYYERLNNRYLPNKKLWFHWQSLRNFNFLMDNIKKPRIYVPTITRKEKPYFALDCGGGLPSGDVLFIQPYEEDKVKLLHDYLNSEDFITYYKKQGFRRGGRLLFTQRLMEQVNIDCKYIR
jgi:adenine-specific DNA-methyltransferase